MRSMDDDVSDNLRGPETSYLIDSVGPVLKQYMAEVLLKRPVDPIDYLGRCLKNHIRVRDAEMKESIENNNELIGLDHFNESETSPEFDPNNSVKEILHEVDDEEIDQNILKFDNQTDDEVTFESQTEQNLNETPTLDEIIDHDDDGTEEVTDSELQ
ncbi:hypothetical protein KSF78_0008415 [Schistosoma japonicum]|nr:hypothetical protein KSF78_0008415 [Schistosoma japonicum]